MKDFSNTSKGMIKDLDILSPDQYSYALNSLLENTDTFPSNDYSNILGYIFEEGEDVVHKLYISELDKVIVFTSKNRILELYGDFNDRGFNSNIPLEYDNVTPILKSRVIASSPCFNWNINYKIDSEYKITDSTLNLYFVDNGWNEDRYIYFNIVNNQLVLEDFFKEILSYDSYNIPSYGENIDCNTLKWYPEVSYPQITTKESEGGQLPAGVYQFASAFATSKGIELTNYKSATNPFHLFSKTITDVTNYDTGKAINIEITNFEKVGRYQYINIAVIKTINGVTTIERIATLPISKKVSYTYTGNNKAVSLDEVSIYQIYPFYRSSKGVTKANNMLFKHGVKEFEKFNLQPLAHKFVCNWFTTSAKLGSYKDPEFAQNYRSTLRDEVYPYSLTFILDNLEETPAMLLIGRPIGLQDIRIVTNTDSIKTEDDCDTNPLDFKQRWQVYNTANVKKTDEIKVSDCEYKQYQEGEFAFWQSTELYPNDPDVWGEQAGKPIRHFKYPDCNISPHFSNVNGEVVIHPIGIKLADEVNVEEILQEAVNLELITQAQKDRIRGYKIKRGNRVNNKSIQAKGLLYNTFQYLEHGDQVVYPNYPFNDLRPDPFLSRESLKGFPQTSYKDLYNRNEFVENKKYTFHSPDTHFVQPALGSILKSEMEVYGEAKGFFNKSRGQGEYVILNQLHYNFSILMGWLLTSKLELEKSQPASTGATIGSGVGAVAGGVIGAFAGGVGAPLGAALGSALGGTIGKLIAGSNTDNKYNEMYRLSMWISQTDRILELLQNTIPMQNYHWQYQAVGKYYNIKKVENNGYKQRRILNSSYLNSTRQLLPNGTKFNNNNRESSVYLELEESIGIPSIQDTSRFTISEKDCDLDEGEEVLSKVSSFYTSIKRQISNQYGDVNAIDWLPVSNKVWGLQENFKEFGGDTFIGEEAFKIKHSFFTNTSFRLPDRTDVYYEDLNNIAYPRHFFNTKYTELEEPASIKLSILQGSLNSMPLLASLNNIENPQSITGNSEIKKFEVKGVQDAIAGFFEKTLMNPYYVIRPGRYSLDCNIDNFVKYLNDFVVVESGNFWRGKRDIGIPNMQFDFTGVKGKIYTYNYGIPSYIVETDINLDLRHAEDPNEGNFYPNINDLNYWLQEENVSPKIDNKYTYNRTYSKQNKEDITLKNDINFFKEKNKIFYENRVIYSQSGAEVENASFKDNYLYFKPLDSFDFSFENGKLISIDAIESEQVLVRFENNLRIVNALNTIPTSGAVDTAIGSGSLFGSRPQEFSKTDGGYIGTQHRDILNTPFGHIMVDAKRGNVFNLQSGGKGIDELSKNGMRNWFQENLPFHISRYFNVDIDNSYNDIGLSLSYDGKYKRFFITKLDYIPKISGIEYSNNKFYYDGKEIRLNDGEYFCNASWTISYSFLSQSWRSFHSFTPNYYIDELDLFHTGINGLGRGLSSSWIHNMTNKSFQTYYSKLRPFEIESVTKFSLTPQILNSIGFKLDVIRNHNKEDKAYVDDVAFNKAIISTDRQNSGLLHLDIIDKNNLFEIKKYPIKQSDGTKILMFKNETKFNFNQFEDLSINNNLPRFINACNNVEKGLNLRAINYNKFNIDNNYIRADKVNIRLINDKHSAYKMIFKGIINDFTPSQR